MGASAGADRAFDLYRNIRHPDQEATMRITADGTSSIGRRSVLQGLGVSAFGLAAAALLGCKTASKPASYIDSVAARSLGFAGGGCAGLTLTAPVSEGPT